MSETTDRIFAFDGDSPDKLAEDIDAQLDEWKDRLAPMIKEMAAEGITVQILFSVYDPLTGNTHDDHLGKGDMNARVGICQWFIAKSLES